MSFIKSIEVENFYSIKNKINVDFEASDYAIENHSERLLRYENKYFSQLNAFYGANASGKSSLLRAIATIATVMTNTSETSFPKSFKNKFNTPKKISKIKVNFVLSIDDTFQEYQYILTFSSLNYLNNAIDNEELYLCNKRRETLINRKKRIVKNVGENVTTGVFNKLNNKKSLIEEFYKFDETRIIEKIHDCFNYIALTSNITNAYTTDITPTDNIEKVLNIFLATQEDKSLLSDFLIRFSTSIGLDIEEITPNYIETENGEMKFDGLLIKHSINTKKDLEFLLESDGTMSLMNMLMNIFLSHISKSPLIIDEVDSILHPMLVPIINKLIIDNNIQIIYTTHNVYNMQFLYSDEITLIEKDKKHITTINPLKNNPDIDPTDNILSLYEEGYLGGIPNFNEISTEILIYD